MLNFTGRRRTEHTSLSGLPRPPSGLSPGLLIERPGLSGYHCLTSGIMRENCSKQKKLKYNLIGFWNSDKLFIVSAN